MADRKTYHLLGAALTATEDDPRKLFAAAVSRVLNGFIDHGQYLDIAERAARQRLSAARLERRMAQLIEHDVNPLADLMRAAPDARTFEQRWNGFNRAVPLGVATWVSNASAHDLRRTARAADAQGRLREQVIAVCVACLLPRHRVGSMDSHADDPRRLTHRLRGLGLDRGGLADCVTHLYEEPASNLAGVARVLQCSSRTLQRELTGAGLSFRTLRQAVRLTLAGHAMRTRGGSLTEIAHGAAFFDSAHLVRAWKAACGVTPSQYRALAGWTPAAK